jgi:hypothetical protein
MHIADRLSPRLRIRLLARGYHLSIMVTRNGWRCFIPEYFVVQSSSKVHELASFCRSFWQPITSAQAAVLPRCISFVTIWYENNKRCVSTDAAALRFARSC